MKKLTMLLLVLIMLFSFCIAPASAELVGMGRADNVTGYGTFTFDIVKGSTTTSSPGILRVYVTNTPNSTCMTQVNYRFGNGNWSDVPQIITGSSHVDFSISQLANPGTVTIEYNASATVTVVAILNP